MDEKMIAGLNVLTEEELEGVSGGAGQSSLYCVEGYSRVYVGTVKLYVSAYQDAVKLCEKLGMSTDCIKEVHQAY